VLHVLLLNAGQQKQRIVAEHVEFGVFGEQLEGGGGPGVVAGAALELGFQNIQVALRQLKIAGEVAQAGVAQLGLVAQRGLGVGFFDLRIQQGGFPGL
nr:hypothetical protein [Tanacetum cinerariifolium]